MAAVAVVVAVAAAAADRDLKRDQCPFAAVAVAASWSRSQKIGRHPVVEAATVEYLSQVRRKVHSEPVVAAAGILGQKKDPLLAAAAVAAGTLSQKRGLRLVAAAAAVAVVVAVGLSQVRRRDLRFVAVAAGC